MRRSLPLKTGKPGLALIEEGFVLVRTCAPATLATYYAGSVPFVAGFLIFWSDFSRNPHASDHLAGATLAMAGLFIWMKFFHARFAARLLAQVCGTESPVLGVRGMLRTVVNQTIIQSSALFVLPLAALAALPFAWVYAFYQNVTVLDDGEASLGSLFKSASKQSTSWPTQNHLLLIVLPGFGLMVFLNWLAVGFTVPSAIKIFLGIESVFTQSPMSMFNTTFIAAMAALTYLCVDPLFKACYVLRCFYGKSLRSGEDLKADLRRFAGRAQALAFCLILSFGGSCLAEAQTSSAPAAVVAGADLDRSISSVIQQDKYAWRLPREVTRKERLGGIRGFIDQILKLINTPLRNTWDLLTKFIDWLSARSRRSMIPGENPVWVTPQVILLFGVLGIVAALLAVFALRILQARRRSQIAQGTPLPAMPDLESENIAADDLPEDGWSRMGRRLLEKGDLRLALRAFYLAGLSHLASRGLVTIARYKSNRDYERELRRRGHTLPELTVIFGENVGIFDRVWYGLHEVSPDLVEHFVANVNRMKTAE